MKTPWGKPDTVDTLAPGITWYSTPSHGGIHLDRAHHSKVKRMFPGWRTFAGGPWYEEDDDVAIVALVFPEAFPNGPELLESAEASIRRSAGWEPARWQSVVAWLDARKS